MAYEFKLPDIGEGLTEGEIVKWMVSKGDTVEEEQPMVEIMTDKATVEIMTPCAGTVSDIRAEEGDTVPVGEIIIVIDNGTGTAKGTGAASAAPAKAKAATEASAPTKAAPAAAPVAATPVAAAPVAATPVATSASNGAPLRDRTLAAPATRKLARELGLDLNAVPASGPHGRVTRTDVQSFADAGGRTAAAPRGAPAAAAASSPAALREKIVLPAGGATRADQVVPLRGLRGKIAAQMVRSKQSPHFTFADECDMTELWNLRKQAKPVAEAQGIKLTFLPFIMKAIVAGFRKFPAMNAVVDDENKQYVVRGEYNIGIATDTDDGLTVPVVKQVDRLSILQIASELERLSVAARSKRIGVEDLKGGTFTITSAGSIGGILATPILNFPEVGIFGVYRIADKPVVRDGEIVVRKMCNFTITLDHRIVDGGTAAHFMNEVIRLLENPGLMLLDGV